MPPLLTNPITVNATQPGLVQLIMKWQPNGSATPPAEPSLMAIVKGYDPVQNVCSGGALTISTNMLFTLAATLAAAGRPALATALEALNAAQLDFANHGIPADILAATGSIINGSL